jgi:hypothetical protein
MKLSLTYQYNLATISQAIEYYQTQLPHLIAQFYLKKIPQTIPEKINQNINKAQQRLIWFECYINLIFAIEELLTASQYLFTISSQGIQQQWVFAIETIGDLEIEQTTVNQLALRLQLIDSNWSKLLKTYHLIIELMSKQDQQYLNQIIHLKQQWQNFWYYLPLLTHPDSNNYIQQSLEFLTQTATNQQTVKI